jgi:hypothetical protein
MCRNRNMCKRDVALNDLLRKPSFNILSICWALTQRKVGYTFGLQDSFETLVLIYLIARLQTPKFLWECRSFNIEIFHVSSYFYSSVSIATHYVPQDPGIASRCGRDFLHPSRPSLGPTQLLRHRVPCHSRKWSSQGVTLITHLHLALRLKKE